MSGKDEHLFFFETSNEQQMFIISVRLPSFIEPLSAADNHSGQFVSLFKSPKQTIARF